VPHGLRSYEGFEGASLGELGGLLMACGVLGCRCETRCVPYHPSLFGVNYGDEDFVWRGLSLTAQSKFAT